MKNTVSLLTIDERASLPQIIVRRNKFKAIIKNSIVNYNRLFSNCLMIQGKPGTGKTTLCETFLEQMKEEGLIAGTKRVPGHVTPKSLFNIINETAEPDKDNHPHVLLLDDVDCLGDEGCLELMKAAFDTKSDAPTNRKVFYFNEKDGKVGCTFRGFGIIICNNDFGNKKLSVHQEALLDRVQQLSIDLQPNDMMVFTTHLLESYLNDNPDELKPEEISDIVNLFNTDIRRWMKYDAFRKARVNYSIRLIKKFVDAQRTYGEDWKLFNIVYQKLEAVCQMEDINNGTLTNHEDVKVMDRKPKARIVKKAKTVDAKKEPKKNKAGKYIKEDGTEYSKTMQAYYKRTFAA